jgi:hypothetical protein
MGEMDALAAIMEYDESPPCIWTHPIPVSVPTKRRESLVKKLLGRNWSAMKRKRAVQQKRTPAADTSEEATVN